MKRETFRIAIGTLTIVVLVLASVGFRVRERTSMLITRFGKPVRIIDDPGLHGKLPWPIDKSIAIDGRTRVFETRRAETITQDKKNVILATYAAWRVSDPLRFHRAVGTIDAADTKLDGLVTSAKIGVLGRYDLDALVSTDPAEIRVDAIEREILAAVREPALDKYGIEIEQVGFQRLSLPSENIGKVFEQMRQERKQFSEAEIAEGEREKNLIQAETDVEKAKIVAEADREARALRGAGEAEAARIIQEAVGSNRELYDFLASSLPRIFSEQTTVILRTDSAPFEFLKGFDFERVRPESADGAGAGAGDGDGDGDGDGGRE